MARNLKPLVPTPTQIKRVLAGETGAGFFIYRASKKTVEVVEFFINHDDMTMRHADTGKPLDYCVAGESIDEAYRYSVTVEKIKINNPLVDASPEN